MRMNTVKTKTRIACIGDSNTDGWPGELDYTSYTNYLQEKLGSAYTVLNFGKFNTTATFSMDDPYIENAAYKKAIKAEPDIVTVMLGANDCKDYNWDSHGKDLRKDYSALVERFLELGTHPKVVLCTPAPIHPDNIYKLNSKIMANEVAPVIREIAKEKNLVLIDVFKAVSEMDDLSLFDADKLHLNNKGHKVVADLLYITIRKFKIDT